jgi:hypothetical protein
MLFVTLDVEAHNLNRKQVPGLFVGRAARLPDRPLRPPGKGQTGVALVEKQQFTTVGTTLF